MGPYISFHTNRFDVAKERENPFNPGLVFGESILIWLKENATRLKNFSAIEAEDHGWYMSADFDSRKYLFTGAYWPPEADDEWTIVVERERSMVDKLLGRGKTNASEPCFVYVKSLLDQDPAFTTVEIVD